MYFPIFNCNKGDLNTVHSMLQHPRALAALSDAGAHVGTVCDASFSTFMLTLWVRDRVGDKLSLQQAVHLLSGRNVNYLGLADRDRIAVGLRADLNLIDPTQLAVGTPHLVRDLPAGGKRFLQKGVGYLGIWVAGHPVQQGGAHTAARTGRLVRRGSMATAAAATVLPAAWLHLARTPARPRSSGPPSAARHNHKG